MPQRVHPAGALRILIVDDDPFIRQVLPGLLADAAPGGERPTIEAVGTAQEASARLAAQGETGRLVVLSDFDLKGARTGIDVLREAATRRPDAQRVLFSGHARSEIRGIDDAPLLGFLDKPFRLEDMVAPFWHLVGTAFAGQGALPADATAIPRGPGNVGALATEEVLPALVKAGLKGEDARARLLFGEARRRGEEDRARDSVTVALSWQNRVLELVATNAPLTDTLAAVAHALERQVPGMLASVMLMDDSGTRLRHGAAPSLPDAYNQALDGMPVGPRAGACGAAAHRRQPVIVVDTHDDPLWAEYRDLADLHGLRACWCTPILSPAGLCYGTIAMYDVRPHAPEEAELALVDLAAGLARVAIESHRDREALRRAEERKSAIVGSALDAIVTMDSDGRVSEWNPSAERLFGYRRDEAMGRPMAELIVPPALREAHWKGLRRYLATGEARVLGRPIEVPAMRRDGGEFPVELSIVALPTEPPVFTAFIRDLTEPQRQKEELRATSERLRAIFQQVSVGVAQFDLEGRFHLVNDRYCELVMRPREELMRLRMDDVTDDEHVAKDRALFDRLVRDGKAVVTDSRFRRPDGTTVWVRRSLSLVRDAQGAPSSVVGVVQEITQQKRAESRLHELNATLDARVQARTKALEEANRDLESFSYVVSHDLRAPLRTISYLLAATQRSLAGTTPPEVIENLEKARRSTQEMNDLMEGLLTLARLSQGDLRREPVDLSALAANVVESLRLAEPRRDVQVRIHAGITVHGDPRLLQSVLDNLIGNAWKFSATRAPAHIEVGATAAHGQTVCFVRDDGPGFDPASAQKLFQPFSRLHPESGPPGLGIGLATVRRIIERHGGQIWAEGAEGKGATFFFTLPTPSLAPT